MNVYEAQSLLLWSGRMTTCAIALVLFVMIYRWRVFKNVPYLLLLIAYLISLTLNVFVIWLIEYTSKEDNYLKIKPILDHLEIDDTFFVDPIFFLKNYIFYGGFVWFSLKKSKSFVLLLLALTLFTIINTTWGESYKNYQAWGTIVDNIFLTSLGGMTLHVLFRETLNKNLIRIPLFWFSISFIVTGVIGGLIDVLSNYMYKETQVLFFQLHALKNMFSILAYLFFAYGVYLAAPMNRKGLIKVFP